MSWTCPICGDSNAESINKCLCGFWIEDTRSQCSMEKITSKEFAEGLLYVLKKFSTHFYADFNQRAQSFLELEFDEVQLATFEREIYIMNLWIISKILSPDKKILDELHKIYLLPHVNQKQINEWLEQKKAENLRSVLQQDESDLRERYQKYYAAWDDKSGSNQAILATTILEYLLNEGQPDRRLIRIDLQFLITNHIFGIMKFVMDFRNKYEVVD